MLAKVRPRDVVGKTRRQVAAEPVAEVERICARKKAADKELTELVKKTGTGLLDLHGTGPAGAQVRRGRRTQREGPAKVR